ncbi:hypothetical protein CHU98_g11658 [Xylaria longipes]|nr:hypothetical protein CHU98_g11658 [Xylaria longipes]
MSPAECSGYIYDASNDSSGDAFLAFDSYYGQELIPNAGTCLPAEVTAWWQQEKVPTTTSLGPEFVCPEAYYTVTSPDTDESFKQVFCCPTQYRVLSLLIGSLYLSQTGKHVFPSQCITTISPGGILEYRQLGRIWTTTVTTAKPDETISVFAVPVNERACISPTSSHFTAFRAEPTMILTTPITTSTCTESVGFPQPMTTTSGPFSKFKIFVTAPPYSTPSVSGQSPGSDGGHGWYSQSDKIAVGVGIGVGLGVGLSSLVPAFVQYRRMWPGARIIFMTTRDTAEREQQSHTSSE